MTDAELLTMLKADVEIIAANTTKDEYLGQLITAAKQYIEREGATLSLDQMEDCNLVVMYAAWLYRKRAEDAPAMPRMLRWALNNRIFSEKVNAE